MNVRLAAVAVAAGAVLAAGCGGSDDGGGDAATEWAGSLCSALTTWAGALTSWTDSLKEGGVSEESISSAVDDMKDATSTLVDDLDSLGAPDIEGGQEAKDTLDGLADDLRQSVDEIEARPIAMGTIMALFNSMASEVSSVFSTLGDLDARGELEDAFRQANECDSLVDGS